MTGIRDRITHLRFTLPKNLAHNQYAQFVILDYGSADPVEVFDHPRVKYCRLEADRWRHAHARNVAFLLADHDLICNLDADNLTGYDFDQYLWEHRSPNVVFGLDRQIAGCVGRVAMAKSSFLHLGGYDEEMIGWGGEDSDILARAALLGYQLHPIPSEFIDTIHIDNSHRTLMTSQANDSISRRNIKLGNLRANRNHPWGVATVRVGKEEVQTSATMWPQ